MTGRAEQLIALEREGWEALVAGGGAAHYRKLLTANAVMAFPFGILSRERTLRAMAEGRPWECFEIHDPQVVELGDDCAVVVYRVIARRPGDEPYAAVVSTTFVREHDGWKLAFHQQSPPA